jgi:hypothetical protein
MDTPVYLEIGKKRIFAGALDWPGWCRSAADEASALQALCEYAPRYARVIGMDALGFQAPHAPAQLQVVERLEGSGKTDMGMPGIAPSADALPVSSADLQRFRDLLAACWQAFDAALTLAAGKDLRTGPRGGGRDLQSMIRHVLEADAAYVAQLGWKWKPDPQADLPHQLLHVRQAALDGLAASAHGEIPALGPRGGLRWSPRYFVRRMAWHELDHAWEIEDRVV